MYLYRYLLPIILLAVGVSAQAATDVSGSISTDTTWATTGSPYIIQNPVTVASGVTLTIEPGVVVKLDGQYTSLNVAGNVQAVGTATELIVFTSYQDDTYAGDTNGDGASSTAEPGDWRQLYMMEDSTAVMEYVVVQYGGQDHGVSMVSVSSDDVSIHYGTFAYNYNYDATFRLESDAMITNNTFTSNMTTAIYSASGSSTITNNIITGCSHGAGIAVNNGSPIVAQNTVTDCSSGLYAYGKTATPFINDNVLTSNDIGINIQNGSIPQEISSNSMHGSTQYGLYNATTANTILAENNWWGDETGPYNATVNPTGLGDTVSDSVDFDPWLTTDPLADVTPPAEVTLGLVQKDPWNKTITLNWTNPTDADFDHVEITRTDRDGTEVVLSADAGGETYTDHSIEYGMRYTYTLFTVDTTGNMSAGVTTDPKRVRSPHVHHLQLRVRDSAIVARWERLPLRLNPAVGYIVYYGTSADALTTSVDVGNSRLITIPELVSGQLYYVAVAAYNGDGVEGPLSNIKSILLWN